MTSKTLLLVEDDPDVRDILSVALSFEGYKILGAQNGKVALDMLEALPKEERPDGIILDLMMPEMDGKTFLETIRRKHPDDLGKIPVVVTTALGDLSTAADIPQDVKKIGKPLNLEEFISTIDGLW